MNSNIQWDTATIMDVTITLIARVVQIALIGLALYTLAT